MSNVRDGLVNVMLVMRDTLQLGSAVLLLRLTAMLINVDVHHANKVVLFN